MPEAASSRPARSSRSFGGHFEEIGIETDILVDRQVFVEAEALRHVAHMRLAALGIRHDIDAVDDDPPPSGRITPASMRMVVVLPAPSGPTRPKISPRSTVKLRPPRR